MGNGQGVGANPALPVSLAITPDHVLEVGLGKLTVLTEHTDHVQSIHLVHIVHHLVVLELWGWLVAIAFVPARQQVQKVTDPVPGDDLTVVLTVVD